MRGRSRILSLDDKVETLKRAKEERLNGHLGQLAIASILSTHRHKVCQLINSPFFSLRTHSVS
jgi:hypothetical protein